MNAVANINSLPSEAYPPLSTSAKQAASGSSTTNSMPVDQVDITPTSQIMQRLNAEDGRVALETAAGNLTSPLSTELYAQVASIQQQISGAEQHDGGNSLEHAAENHERHNRDQQKAEAAAGHRGHRHGELAREA